MSCRAGLTAFCDLFFNEMVMTCASRQLDSVVGVFLRESVEHFEWTVDNFTVTIMCSDANSMYTFLPGISFRFFRECIATKELKIVGTGILSTTEPIAGNKLKLYFDAKTKLQDIDEPEKYSKLFVAPGKTFGHDSKQDEREFRRDQLLWLKEDHVVKTIVYGFVDVFLTILLADRLKSGAELHAANVFLLPPFIEVDIRSKSGQKIQMLHADLYRRAGLFQAKITMPQQIAFYTRALEIEGVRRADLPNRVKKNDFILENHPIVEAPCSSSLREMMEMATPNIPEFQLGLTAAFDNTNYREIKERVDKLIAKN